MIPSKFSDLCGAGASLSMDELEDAERKCRKTVKSLLKTNLRH